jgi:hypothetical protein
MFRLYLYELSTSSRPFKYGAWTGFRRTQYPRTRVAGSGIRGGKVFPLRYKGDLICSYTADLVVDDKIILELKAVQELNSVMFAQLINYLRLSGVPIGYLINFNKKEVSWRRFSIDPNN